MRATHKNLAVLCALCVHFTFSSRHKLRVVSLPILRRNIYSHKLLSGQSRYHHSTTPPLSSANYHTDLRHHLRQQNAQRSTAYSQAQAQHAGHYAHHAGSCLLFCHVPDGQVDGQCQHLHARLLPIHYSDCHFPRYALRQGRKSARTQPRSLGTVRSSLLGRRRRRLLLFWDSNATPPRRRNPPIHHCKWWPVIDRVQPSWVCHLFSHFLH